MDSIRSKPTNAGGLVHTFSKVFRLRSTGIVSDDGSRKFKFQNDPSEDSVSQASAEEEKLRRREAMEALLAKLFASISAIKAAYAQLQTAQSPYDPEVIQSADETVVSELKGISELKHGYLKKQILPSQETQMLAQIQEQQNLLKTYEIMSKKLQSQLQLKSREIAVLEQKMHESEKQNKSLERRLNPRSSLSALDNIRLSALNPNHFIAVLRQTKKSIRSFVKLMVREMESAGWDLDAAASSIEPGAVFLKPSHRFFAFESYVCRKIFSDFQHPSFISDRSSKERQSRRRFFDSFTELKSFNAMEFLSRCPESAFGKFCRLKYLCLVHPKMELAFSGELSHRNLINSNKFPESPFFSAFSEMARTVWLLHSLAYSFEPEASIFQVRPGSRFSEVYMESACDDWVGDRPHVCFTVAPGFRIGKTVVQCKVYLLAGSGDAGEGR